jgi:hypothetical protein
MQAHGDRIAVEARLSLRVSSAACLLLVYDRPKRPPLCITSIL